MSSPLKLGQLAVHSKELQSVTIRKYKDPIWRHDTWPFFALYLCDAILIAYYASRYEW